MAIQQRKIPFINPDEIKQLNQQQQEEQQQMMNNNPLDYYGNSSNYQPVAPPGAIQNGQNSVIITSPSQVRPSHATIQMTNNRGVVSLVTQKTQPSSMLETATATTQAPIEDLFQPSTQTYWVSNEQLLEETDESGSNNNNNNDQCLADGNNNNAPACNLKGFCDKKAGCSCLPGFSGPTCAIGKCFENANTN